MGQLDGEPLTATDISGGVSSYIRVYINLWSHLKMSSFETAIFKLINE